MSKAITMELSRSATDFIDEGRIEHLLEKHRNPEKSLVREILAKSEAKIALTDEETAVLLNAEDPALVDEVFETARRLKRKV